MTGESHCRSVRRANGLVQTGFSATSISNLPQTGLFVQVQLMVHSLRPAELSCDFGGELSLALILEGSLQPRSGDGPRFLTAVSFHIE